MFFVHIDVYIHISKSAMPDPSKKTTSLSWIPLKKSQQKELEGPKIFRRTLDLMRTPCRKKLWGSDKPAWGVVMMVAGWGVIVLCGWCNLDLWWTNLLVRKVFCKKKSRGNMSPMEDSSDLVLVSAAPAGRRFPFHHWKVPFMDSVIAIFWSNLSGFVMSIMPWIVNICDPKKVSVSLRKFH